MQITAVPTHALGLTAEEHEAEHRAYRIDVVPEGPRLGLESSVEHIVRRRVRSRW